jgi:ADP-ribose pyrophosphatase YjhB (NUDIX family)
MAYFTIASFVVLFDKKDRVLLSHRRDLDIWNLPGGGVESGELPTEAAIRETREETGLKIKIDRMVGVYGKPHRDELIFVFIGQVIGGKLKVTDEADQSRYFRLDKLPKNTIPKHVERIQDAINGKKQPVFRRQHSLSAREWLKKLVKR